MNLVSNNKNNLKSLYGVCDSYFKLCDIKANPNKFELLNMNTEETEIEVNDQIIKKSINKNGIRYLGIYIRENLDRKVTINRMKRIINNAVRQMKFQKWVIIPALEYQLQVVTISEEESDRLTGPMKKLIKRKTGLAQNTPNFILHDQDCYAMKDLYQLQIEHHTKNLLYIMNSNREVGITMRIRIDQIIHENWVTGCIFENIEKIKGKKNDILIRVIKMLNENGIRMCKHSKKNKHQDNRGEIEINIIIGNELESKSIDSLRRSNKKKRKRRNKGDRWEELEEKFEAEEVREFKDINERNIIIDEIMERLENIKIKTKEVYLENYFRKESIKYIIYDKKEIMSILEKDSEGEDGLQFKINSKDEEKNYLIKETTMETTTKNMKKRCYRIKNFIKELPTMEILNRRSNKETSKKCVRCNIEDESWTRMGM
ncbi:hypothetical protein C1645_813262 [Glomus cerebriforme]|uniref:Reverse transcriptase domain-containing protein n=1 Tax=Glomus cerebriforme TaxID=658196 RepID=A0A397TII2_9GLOM|nr:hypothetical protein C1645_813262 [Glomus cerebriforme]